MDVDACQAVLASVQTALDGHVHMVRRPLHARSVLEPCPAAARRATAFRAAYERHVKARRGLTAGKRSQDLSGRSCDHSVSGSLGRGRGGVI